MIRGGTLLWVATGGDAYNSGEYRPLVEGRVGEGMIQGHLRVGQWSGVKGYYGGASHFTSAVGV